MNKCIMCNEEKAIKQIPNPNNWDNSDEWWDVCWECDQYIKWSHLHMMSFHFGMEIKPFDEWLFEKEGVYPKHKWMACILKKGNKKDTK